MKKKEDSSKTLFDEPNKPMGGKTKGCLIILLIFMLVGGIIGTVAYKGMTGAARASKVKTIHYQTIKSLSEQLQKCKKDKSAVIYGKLDCSNYNNTSVIEVLIKTSADKNPYSQKVKSAIYSKIVAAIRSSASNTNDDDVGYVSLSSSGSNIIIKSCKKTPCKKEENRQQSAISIK
jgi:gas vesicle protein